MIPRMNQLIEWSPLLVFFVVFKLYGHLLGDRRAHARHARSCCLCTACRTGRFKTMHVVTAGVILVLGTATLLLHDKRFIQWKPTVLLALTALAFLGSTVIGRQPLGAAHARRRLQRASGNLPAYLGADQFALGGLVLAARRSEHLRRAQLSRRASG